MAVQPEISNFDSGVYQIEVNDPVLGGLGGVANAPLLNLANRTKYLKDTLDGVRAGTGSAIILPTNSTAHTEAGNDDSNKIATTAQVQNAIGLRTGLRNLFINGSMEVFQRGSSVSVPANNKKYALDRWLVISDNTGSRTCAVTKDTTVLPAAYAGARAALKIAAGAGANIITLQQRIEHVLTLAGKQITISFVAYSTVAQTATLTINLYKTTSTASSQTPDASGGSVAVNLTTSPQRFEFTFVLPDLSAQAATLNAGSCIEVQWLFPSSSAYNVYITNAQFESGESASDFENLPIVETMQRCKRYYEAVTVVNQDDGAYVSAYNHYLRVGCMVQKRTATPTMVLGILASSGGITSPAISASDDMEAVIIYTLSTFSAATRSDQYSVTWESEL